MYPASPSSPFVKDHLRGKTIKFNVSQGDTRAYSAFVDIKTLRVSTDSWHPIYLENYGKVSSGEWEDYKDDILKSREEGRNMYNLLKNQKKIYNEKNKKKEKEGGVDIVPQSNFDMHKFTKMISNAKIAEKCTDNPRHLEKKGSKSGKRKQKKILRQEPHSSSKDRAIRMDLIDKICARCDIEPQALFPTNLNVTHEISEGLSTLINGVLEIISKIDVASIGVGVTDSIRNLASSIKSITIDGLQVKHSFVDNLWDYAKNNAPFVAFVLLVCIGIYFRSSCGTSVVVSIVKYLANFVLDRLIGTCSTLNGLLRKIVSWCSFTTDDVEPHMYGGCIIDSVIAYIFLGHLSKSMEKKHASEMLSSFFEKTASMKKVKEGAEFTFNFFINKLQALLNYMSKNFGIKEFHIAMDKMPHITEYSIQVDEMTNEYARGKVLNFESAEEILAFHRKGMKLQKEIPIGPEYMESRKLLIAAIAELSPLLKKIQRTNLYNNGPRVEPVGVFITGPPGVGKTTALIPILLAVTASTLPADKRKAFETNHNDFIYNRISENVFFDSYNGQWNCIFDDLGQVKDVAGAQCNVFMEFIRMVNSNNMDLHMAHLEDKGNVNFRSKMVWATSNVQEFRLNSLIRSDALTRRFKKSYMVIPARGFRVDENEPDPWKMRKSEGKYTDDYSHLIFLRHDASTGLLVDSEELSISTVIQELIEEFNKNEVTGERLLNSQQFFKEKYLKRAYNSTANETLRKSLSAPTPFSYLRETFSREEKVEDDNEPQGNLKISMTHDELLKMAGIYEVSSEVLQEYFPSVTDRFSVAGSFDVDDLAKMMDEFARRRTAQCETPLGRQIRSYKQWCIDIYNKVYDAIVNTGLYPILSTALQCIVVFFSTRAILTWLLPSAEKLAKTTTEDGNPVYCMYPALKPGCAYYSKFKDDSEQGYRWAKFDDKGVFVNNNPPPLDDMKDCETVEWLQLSEMIAQSSLRNRGGARNKNPGAKDKSKRQGFKPRHTKNAGKGHRQLRSGRVDIDPQLAYDSNCHDIMTKIFKKNMYSIRIAGHETFMGHITFIAGHDAVMPLHFTEKIYELVEFGLLKDTDSIEIVPCSNRGNSFKVQIKDLEPFYPDEWEGDDVVFVRFPNTIPNAPDIRKYFLDDFDRTTGRFTGSLLIPDLSGNCRINTTYMMGIRDLPYLNYESSTAFSYNIPTAVGDCGGLCAIADPTTGARKLIGLHVAGKKEGGTGYAVKVSKDMIDFFYELFQEPSVRDDVSYEDKEIQMDMDPKVAGFLNLYKARKSNVPKDTNIVPSPLHDTYSKPAFIPGPLRSFRNDDGVTIDPWSLARLNYAKQTMAISIDHLQMCTSSYANRIMIASCNDVTWKPRIFTFEEAVRGIPGIPNCEGIPRNTSAGYPYNLDLPPGERGKSHFFGKDGEYEFTSDHCINLRKRVEYIVDKAKEGIRVEHIYNDFLKDERRPIEKARAGKARLVSASPVCLLICMRIYFMDFVRWYMNNRLNNGSAVGINPYSTDWDTMYRMFNGNRKTKNMIAGDFKAYDGSINRIIMVQFLEFVNKWYNDGNDLIREVLFEEVCNSKHIYEDVVYEWTGGNPSGCFLTTILNTFSNNVIMRYGCLLTYATHLGRIENTPALDPTETSTALILFEKHVFMLAFGDDNELSVGEGTMPWFNQQTLHIELPKFGFEYTLENKEVQNTEPYRNIFSTTFLKRGWRFEPILARIVAPLELSVVLEMAQWTKKKDRNFDYVRTNVDNALKELSIHDAKLWEMWASPIKRNALLKLDHFSTITDRRNAMALQIARDLVDME